MCRKNPWQTNRPRPGWPLNSYRPTRRWSLPGADTLLPVRIGVPAIPQSASGVPRITRGKSNSTVPAEIKIARSRHSLWPLHQLLPSRARPPSAQRRPIPTPFPPMPKTRRVFNGRWRTTPLAQSLSARPMVRMSKSPRAPLEPTRWRQRSSSGTPKAPAPTA